MQEVSRVAEAQPGAKNHNLTNQEGLHPPLQPPAPVLHQHLKLTSSNHRSMHFTTMEGSWKNPFLWASGGDMHADCGFEWADCFILMESNLSLPGWLDRVSKGSSGISTNLAF
eukprot:1159442-Pelagomonas_calceolata.AAC.8